MCDTFWDSSNWGKATTCADKEEKNVAPSEKMLNMINHPIHYNREGAIECIDEMELVFGAEPTANFCLLNCWKYRYRAGLKNNGYEDLEKSDWYMQKYKELKEKINKQKSLTIGNPEIRSYNPLLHNIQCTST